MTPETESHIREAARLFGCFHWSAAVQICEERGYTPAEIRTGGLLYDVQARDRELTNGIFGRPEYGSQSITNSHREAMRTREQAVLDAHQEDIAAPAPLTDNPTGDCPF